MATFEHVDPSLTRPDLYPERVVVHFGSRESDRRRAEALVRASSHSDLGVVAPVPWRITTDDVRLAFTIETDDRRIIDRYQLGDDGPNVIGLRVFWVAWQRALGRVIAGQDGLAFAVERLLNAPTGSITAVTEVSIADAWQ